MACKHRVSPVATGTAGRGGAGLAGRGGTAAGGSSAGGGGGVGAGSGGATSGPWTSVPGVSPCVLEAADPARLEILPFAWAVCGPGCLTTSTKVLATDDTVFNRMASARFDGREVQIRFGTMEGGHYYMSAVRRLLDGTLLAAVRATGPTDTGTVCSPLGFGPSAPHVIGFQRGDTQEAGTLGTTVVGLLKSGVLVWAPPIPGISTIQTSVLENDLGWGFALYDGTLRVKMPVDSAPLAVIDQGSYPAYSAVGWGSLVVSNPAPPGSSDEAIRAWEPDGPSRTIVAQADTGIPGVALSDTTMAWVGVHGPARQDGTYTAAELYWTAFPAGKNSVPIMGGIALAGIHGFQEVQTWGDYVVTTGYPDGAMHASIYAVRLSDSRVWTVRSRPGAILVRLLAITPAEIVVGENDDTGDPKLASQMQHLTRYQFAHLDDLATAW